MEDPELDMALQSDCLKLGAKVIICSRNEEKLARRPPHDLSTAFGECCIPKHVIFGILNRSRPWQSYIDDRFGKLDILVNNAGGQFPSLAENISENGWNAVINNNLNGTFYVTKTMANRFFIPSNNGTIVNITANIIRGIPGMAHTASARAGVETMTKTLAQEWARFNIRINCVAPGIIDSSGLGEYNPMVQALLDTAKEDILMKRLGTVDDVVKCCLFFCKSIYSVPT